MDNHELPIWWKVIIVLTFALVVDLFALAVFTAVTTQSVRCICS